MTSFTGSVRRGFWGFEKSQWVEFLPQKKVDFHLLAKADGKVIIERLCLSLPHVEKPFNSKVIKNFVPELRSRKVFRVLGFLCYLCASWTLWTFYVLVWICLFQVFISGYVTILVLEDWWLNYLLHNQVCQNMNIKPEKVSSIPH